MALTNVNVVRKHKLKNDLVYETSKILKLLKKEVTSIPVVHRGLHIALTDVNGCIEIDQVDGDFPVDVAGNIVMYFQNLYEQISLKFQKA